MPRPFKRTFDLIYFYFIFSFDNPKTASDIAPRMDNTNTTTTGAGNLSAVRHVTLGKGCGYWDITRYPRGGCFRRAGESFTAKVIDGPAIFGGSDIREYLVELPSGGKALFPCSGVNTIKVTI